MTMSSISDLAREFDCEPNTIRAFYQDGITREMRDTDELPADIEATIRQAWDYVSGPCLNHPMGAQDPECHLYPRIRIG